MTTIVEFLTARLDEEQAEAVAAQEADPAPWRADINDGASTWLRSGHGAGLVIAADDEALWDCEGSSALCMTAPTARHVARHDPARVLREVEAKRARLALYVEVTDILFRGSSVGRIKYQRESGRFEALDVEVRRDAALYDEHPDYEQAWAVT